MGPYGLAIVLAALYLLSHAGHLWFGWQRVVDQASTHGEDAAFRDYLATTFLSETFENWQSEFLQILTMVVLTSVLIFRGSEESRDGSDRMEAKIDDIKKSVDRIRDDQRDAKIDDILARIAVMEGRTD